MIKTKMGAFLLAAFIAGAFLASPELRAYAANTVGSADIINNSVQSVDIKDGEVKAADIATDAVGANEIATNAVGGAEIAANAVGSSEIIGVSNLIFAECTKTNNASILPNNGIILTCGVAGAGSGDVAIANVSKGSDCFAVTHASGVTDYVRVIMKNACAANASLGTATVAIIVFDTAGVIIPPF